MRHQNSVFLGMLFIVIFLSNCSMDSDDTKDLPVQTIRWEKKDGYSRFYTNDDTRYNVTFWEFLNTDTNTDFTNLTGTVKKKSGNGGDNGYYGFIFCVLDGENLYRVVISTEGRYCAMKRIGAYTTNIFDWKTTPNLNQGFNVENTITVTRSAAGVFNISFNGVPTDSFTATELSKNTYGPCVRIGREDEESFPNVPVEAFFKISNPAAYP